MSKKAMFVWCIALGLLDGIYCICCAHIPHVQHFMWIGFISLPIFFAGGANLAHLPRYAVCSVCGVLWGALTLILMTKVPVGSGNMPMFVWVVIVVCIACYVHMQLLHEGIAGGVFASAPAMFGGFAAIFSQGNGELPWVILTLLLGLALGGVMGWVAGPITKAIDGGGEE